MTVRTRRAWGAAATAALLALPLLPTARAADRAGSCESGQRAVSFHSADTSGQPAGAQACATSTGKGGAETHIRLAADGTAVEEPAVVQPGLAGTGFAPGLPGPRPETQFSPAGLSVGNNGTDWDFVLPAGATWVAQDAAIHIDRPTGRVYYYGLAVSPSPQGGDVPIYDQAPSNAAHLTSAKLGELHGHWNYAAIPGYVNSENPRFTSAPVPAGGTAAAGGERPAYWCGNNMLFTFVARACYRTLDGGASWELRSIFETKGVPRHTECGSSGEDLADGDYPVGDETSGALWSLVSCGGKSFLARSTDEAATFPIVEQLPFVASELRVDTAGNLYAAALNGTALNLWVKPKGGTWSSAPLDLTVPSARSASIGQWALAVRDPGQVAVAYLVARQAPGTGFDGWITVTKHALAANPVFTAAAVNDPDTQLVTSSQQAKDDFIDVDIATGGVPWAAFYGDCKAGDPSCDAAQGAPNPLAKRTIIGRILGV